MACRRPPCHHRVTLAASSAVGVRARPPALLVLVVLAAKQPEPRQQRQPLTRPPARTTRTGAAPFQPRDLGTRRCLDASRWRRRSESARTQAPGRSEWWRASGSATKLRGPPEQPHRVARPFGVRAPRFHAASRCCRGGRLCKIALKSWLKSTPGDVLFVPKLSGLWSLLSLKTL